VELAVIWRREDVPQEIPRLVFDVLIESSEERMRLKTPQEIALLEADVRAQRKKLSTSHKKLLDWIISLGLPPAAQAMPVKRASDWVTLLHDQRAIRWEDGGDVDIQLHPARLTLLREPKPAWAVAFPAPDVEPVPLERAEILREVEGPSNQPQLWVRKGAMYPLDTLGMPSDLFQLVACSPELPLELLQGQVAGALLARKLTASIGAAESSGLVRTVRVRPRVEIRLEDETRYTISVRAFAGDGTELVRTHEGAWVEPVFLPRMHEPDWCWTQSSLIEPIDAPAEAEHASAGHERAAASPGTVASDAIAVVPCAEDVAHIDAWLARLVPSEAEKVAAGSSPAFRWRADGAATVRLVRSWLARPSNVSYYGDCAFKRLVRVQDAPRLHIETRGAQQGGGGIDWLEVSVELEDELASLSLTDIADALEQSEDEILMIRGVRLYRREHLMQYLQEVEALYDSGIVPMGGWQKVHRRRIEKSSSPMDAPINPHTRSFLRPYQEAGADFLVQAAGTFGGALLADDMGLGKTLQTISALTALSALSKGAGEPARPSLVICPASVAHNWRREAAKFAPHLRTIVIEGGEKRRQILLRLGGRDPGVDLVIENFALVRRDIELLEKAEFQVVAVDEAQAIKNPDAETTRAVKRLRARHRIALTGTPIENRLTDLWSIVDFLAPTYLGSRTAFEQTAKDQDSTVFHRMLRGRMRPLLIRRLKRDVAPELPERIEERLDCEMTEGQRTLYLAEVKRTRLLLEGVTSPEEMSGENRVRMLAALTRLRQICCEPSLVDLGGRGSGKVDELMELLPELLEAGHKVLVFSQFVRMLELLTERLDQQRIPFRMLTGQTQDRMQVVDAFENDPTPSVFLISLKAGGTGLNLTSASHVVLFDPWWSPALEAQAIDRSHRIGQDKTVVAIRLVTKGTIEERILELQERKRSLSRDILESDAESPSLTPEELGFLLQDA
jgi:superfamily II DNA or RNA helicase